MLKSYGVGWWGGGVVAHEILVSAQGPSVLGFGVLGLRVWGLGLTITAKILINRCPLPCPWTPPPPSNTYVCSLYHQYSFTNQI